MFDKFTHKSQEAIINAQVIAQDNGQQHIEAVHVLAALLEQPDSLIKPILEKLKIAPAMLDEKVWDQIDKLPKVTTAPNAQIGMVQGTAEVALILEKAKKEAVARLSDFSLCNSGIKSLPAI